MGAPPRADPGRGEGPASPSTVAVATLTYRRPHGLARLLEGIAELQVDDEDALDVKIVVVDNEPHGPARAVVDAVRPRLRWPIEHVVEPRRGIPQARNRAVAAAAPFDFLAFVDDDEVPDPGWLRELVRVQRATGADVVTGPVLPRFEEEPPDWVVRGGFFERPRYPNHQRITYARTSSVLIAERVFPRHEPPFNEAMALSGGSDTHFFMRAHRAGHTMVWADEAVVHEWVPASRANVAWLLKREYRRGVTLSRCLVDLDATLARRAKRAASGVLHIARGVALVVLAAARGRAMLVTGLRKCVFGAGLITGLLGFSYHEYRVTHGG